MSSQGVKIGAVWNVRSPAWGYGVAIAATLLAGLMRWAMQPVLGAQMPHVTFYVSVSVAAWYGGLGPALMALGLGALVADFFFVPPFYRLTIHQLTSAVDISLFFFVGLTISLLSEMLHRERLRVEETGKALVRSTRAATEILASMTEAYFTVDRDWRLLEANQALAEHLGRDTQLILGKRVWDLLPDLEASVTGQKYQQAMAEQKPVSFEAESVVLKGHWLWFHVYPKPDRLYVYFRDITDRKTAEAALLRREHELNDFFENATIGLHWLSEDGVILKANRTELEMMGCEPQEYIGRRFAEFHVKPDACRELMERLRRGETVENYEVLLQCKDRSIINALVSANVLREDGKFVHARCFMRNVTPRRRAEAALRESEERFRVMAETVPEILFTNRPDGSNDYVSHRFYEFTGLKNADGNKWVEALHPDDRERVFNRWQHCVATGEAFEIEFRMRSATGNYRWFLTRSQPIRDALGQIVRWFGACTDIDVWKQAQAELKIAKDEAERASRAKDAFLAALSHELRTPLTPVLMTLTAMETDEPSPKLASELAMMRRNVELETKLIDDLLDLTRISRGKIQLHPQAIDVHDTITQAIETCCRSDVHEKKLHLQIHLEAEEHHAWADWARLQQVLWNVLKNAIKFTPEQGTIRVETRNEKCDWLTIEVKDNGVGIEPDALPRIFNAFEQEDVAVTRQFGGLGLGLAISKKICGLHGGSICAASEGKGKGATFTIRLPTIKIAEKRERQDKPDQSATSKEEQVRQRLRILLVEDHESTARVMARLLERMEHQVKVAGDVQSALQLAGSESFDLIVSDLGLPDGSGHELMRQLRGQYAIPGICLSGYGMEEDVRKSLEAGFAEHLTKPLNFDQFRAAVNRVARR